jgi:hypothetical protein
MWQVIDQGFPAVRAAAVVVQDDDGETIASLDYDLDAGKAEWRLFKFGPSHVKTWQKARNFNQVRDYVADAGGDKVLSDLDTRRAHYREHFTRAAASLARAAGDL